MMYGHRETPEQWVNHILLLRDIQSRTGGFTEFVPLGFIHDHTLLVRTGIGSRRAEPSKNTSGCTPWLACCLRAPSITFRSRG